MVVLYERNKKINIHEFFVNLTDLIEFSQAATINSYSIFIYATYIECCKKIEAVFRRQAGPFTGFSSKFFHTCHTSVSPFFRRFILFSE